jgi:PcrA/UvrD tudor domain
MNLKAGQYIRHAKYGCGTIVERDDDRTTVEFDTAGVKKFVTSLAAFEVAEGEAPKKKRVTSRRRAKALPN